MSRSFPLGLGTFLPRLFLRTRQWLLPTLFGIIIFLALLLLALLAAASANTEFFEQYFSLLYSINIAVAILLIVLIASLAAAVVVRLRQRKFGTRLMAKLALFFGIVGVLPGIIIYLVSYQFVSRSIESWFDVKVEAALESGLNLGRLSMESALANLQDKARVMASQLSAQPQATGKSREPHNPTLALARLREQFGVEEATLLNDSGMVLASTSSRIDDMSQELPSPAMLAQAKGGEAVGAVEVDDLVSQSPDGTPKPSTTAPAGRHYRLRAVVMLPALNAGGQGNAWSSHWPSAGVTGATITLNQGIYLQVVQRVPLTLASNAEAVETAYREYQEKALGRVGLRKMYIGTLTLALFLAVFVAVMLAVLLGGQLARPLLLLLKGTQEVAEGDLSPKRALPGRDELGFLTQQFSQMTRQLSEARTAAEHSQQAVEQAKVYLESILSNLTAGVLVLDETFQLSTANAGAERILKQPLHALLGTALDQQSSLHEFTQAIRQAFAELETQQALFAPNTAPDHWQKQLAFAVSGEVEPMTLLMRGTRLRHDALGHSLAQQGYVVVFDDISDVMAAQRSVAWGEVARRLAHEIKNPLTPIQLSAERLQMKLADKLPPSEAEMLRKSATTIVNQVAAMKQMVDDFRNYARIPPANMQAIALNELVAELLQLYGVEANQPPSPTAQGILLGGQLADGLPLILGDPTQLRQVIHNLLQNAQDTVEDNLAQGRAAPAVWVTTEVAHYATPQGELHSAVRLSVRDNGPGFAPRVLQRAFEPYITTKAKGTGLGLAMVKKIVDEHGAQIEIRNLNDTASQTSSTIDPELGKSNSALQPARVGAQVTILFLRMAQHALTTDQPSAVNQAANHVVQGA